MLNVLSRVSSTAPDLGTENLKELDGRLRYRDQRRTLSLLRTCNIVSREVQLHGVHSLHDDGGVDLLQQACEQISE